MLGPGPTASIQPVSQADGMIELSRHLYGARFGLGLSRSPGGARRWFDQCARLVTRVPLRRVTSPRSVPSLRTTALLVEADLASGA
jgi:hypothetical protein